MNKSSLLPLSRPYVPKKSKRYLAECLKQDHQQGDGKFGGIAVELIEKITTERNVFLTPSCTSSLEIASLLIDLQPGDEVILPSFNFTSAALAIVKFGAVPVFIDVNPVTKCIDTDLVEEAISTRTRAISWVNYAGFAPDLDQLRRIARTKGLFLIEDNAHALGASYRNIPLGKTGDFATYSFHSTKNIQCGEGGAISIANDDLLRKTSYIREKGTNRIDMNLNIVDKYTWVEKGSSYLLSEIQAALLVAGLQSHDYIQNYRRSIYNLYVSAFNRIKNHVPIECVADEAENSFASHLFYIEVENSEIS